MQKKDNKHNLSETNPNVVKKESEKRLALIREEANKLLSDMDRLIKENKKTSIK